MADQNPMAGPRVVSVDLPPAQTEILREELRGWLAGIEEDLTASSKAVARTLARTEEEAFGRLLTALDRHEIRLPDEAARSALERAAEGYDEASAYERVVAVHDAHHALLSVLG